MWIVLVVMLVATVFVRNLYCRFLCPTGAFLARVARGIAYRAVRTRGTIGGSLAHADPAADWLSCLSALDAQVRIAGPQQRRAEPVASFVRGAMQANLAPDEIVSFVRIPKFSPRARFGYHKICRKTGEFAEAIGVAVRDPDRRLTRLIASSNTGAPLVLEIFRDGARRYGPREFSPNIIRRLEEACGVQVLGTGFPAQMLDEEPKVAGYEVRPHSPSHS